ncbi:hypothetical protein [Anaeromicropila populeti]|uniref:RanBP2-type domain-containing protein n=1 Tax=Anaeromicropila populeti TaxID=37658 RepID=A0A1I6JDW1_9FIRM|nr:hypothetical protein [Anaeromicropila populeti]SFR77213.1 hypothetical protein SAMN05661086_01604 [Anaeromicropila populeti]
MKNGVIVSVICKIITIIIGVMGLIGSFVNASTWGTYGTGGVIIFVQSLFLTFLGCIVFYSLSIIIDFLIDLNERAYDIQVNMERNINRSNPNLSNSQLDLLSLNNGDETNMLDVDTWKCKKCGTVNRKANSFCKDCGTYR